VYNPELLQAMLSGLSVAHKRSDQQTTTPIGVVQAHETRRKKRALKSPREDATAKPGEMKAFNLCDRVDVATLFDEYDALNLEDKQLLASNIFWAAFGEDRQIFVFEFGVIVYWGFERPDIA
jgi:uncharacterized Rmd1/YagE family protein